MEISDDLVDVLSKYFGDVDVVRLREAQSQVVRPLTHILIDAGKQDVLNVFIDRMDRHQEVSERMYHLSGEVIVHVNSADYSAWAWRWKCFLYMSESGGRDLVYYEKEMMRSVVTANPKNYQLWNHRRKLAVYQGSSCLQEELSFTKGCLEFDAKNYHVWAHRQSLLRLWGTSADVDAEFTCASEFLERDCMNNSAWTQRAFLLQLPACEKTVEDEIEFVKSQISQCVENEAAWAYLKYLALYGAKTQAHVEGYLSFCSDFLQTYPRSIEVASAVFDYYRMLLRQIEDTGVGLEKIQEYKDRMSRIRTTMVQFDPLCTTRFTL